MLRLIEIRLKLKKLRKSIISWFLEYEQLLIYLVGAIIITSLSFVFGVLKGAELSQEPITVMRPQSAPIVVAKECENDINILKQKDCIYVGSIKGRKYYPPSCSYAKKISKENLRCFTSDKDATDKGYTKSTSCK